MTGNVGTVDRVLRLVIGLALVAWAVGLFAQIGAVPSPWSWVVGIIGAELALSALFGWSPVYSLLRVNTDSKRA